MLLQFLHEVVASLVLPLFAKYNGSLHHHTTDIVRNTCNGTLYDSRVGHEGRLNLERANAIA